MFLEFHSKNNNRCNIYLFKSNPAALSEPFVGAKALEDNLTKRKTGESPGIINL